MINLFYKEKCWTKKETFERNTFIQSGYSYPLLSCLFRLKQIFKKMNMTDSFLLMKTNPPHEFLGIQPTTGGFCDLHPPNPPPEAETAPLMPDIVPRVGHLGGQISWGRLVWKPLGWYPTWRIIPFSKWLITPIYKPIRPFGRVVTLLRGLTNHGY